ncbi:disintegrin and metalloproteinase domain-containing protein 21-like [Tamandua tetradactyla]|uniref:disintegrin and metalloproteinase domain-containing protein 21-like n=1 Tax=Tamandua tetradactyla TaxID=48850 RepID=UPI0040538AD0
MTASKALLHLRITLLLHWLGVFLSFSGHTQAEHSQYHSPPEVVIPLKVTGRGRGTKAPGWISYRMYFGGQKHIVHMKVKKILLARHLPVFTYTDQGALLEDQPFIQNDCYYHGSVEGDPESLVALSTCFGGFRGVLQINDIAYEIQPVMSSATFEHLVYKMDGEGTQFPNLRLDFMQEETVHKLDFPEISNSTLKQSSYEGWWAHEWFLELAIVVDNTLYLHFEQNVSKVQENIYNIINIVDSIYDVLGINIQLFGIEIWTDENFIIVDNVNTVLAEFSKWKIKNFSNRIQHDAVQFFINKALKGLPGMAYLGGVCKKQYNFAIVTFQGKTWNNFANSVAHELGHVLGMPHDDKTCVCGQKQRCIMNSQKVGSVRFSNCSYASLWKTTVSLGQCLRYAQQTDEIFILKRCGNGIVEEEEECDCGPLKNCDKDPCCLSNCTLSSGSACAFGLCCKNCQFLPSGEICRKQINECDLPEWCNGTSHECPDDVYVQNGNPCNDTASCYEKRCNSHNEQCKQIFGKEAKSANKNCYQEVNTKGDRFGNCGKKDSVYKSCNTSDILCGRIQCENVKIVPFLKEHYTVLQTHVNGVTCWGTDYHFGMTIPDIGDVKDGTECGQKLICIHRKCVSMSLLKSDCSPQTCNMRGVCNSKHHCHCHNRWSPPYCLEHGDGGSIDSGPPPKKREIKKFQLSVMWLIPLFFLFLCLFFGVYKKCQSETEK